MGVCQPNFSVPLTPEVSIADRARTYFSAEYAAPATQTKIKSGKECSSGKEEDLGTQSSVDACRAACIAKKGASCRFFIFGTGSKAGACYWEESCDSFSTNKYDAYTVVTPKGKCTCYTPKVTNVSLTNALCLVAVCVCVYSTPNAGLDSAGGVNMDGSPSHPVLMRLIFMLSVLFCAAYTCTDDTVEKDGYNSESQNLFSASTKDDAKSKCEEKCEQTCAAYLLHIYSKARYKCELYQQGYTSTSAGSDNTRELCKKKGTTERERERENERERKKKKERERARE